MKSTAKLEKLSFFQENQGQLFQFCPGRIEASFLHVLDLVLCKMFKKMPKNL